MTTVRPGAQPVLRVVEFHRIGSKNFDYCCTHFDWRYFGLSNDSQCVYRSLAIAIDFPKYFTQPGIRTRTDRRGDAQCLVAALNLDKFEQSVWLSERDEMHPVYFEERFESGGEPHARVTEVSWQRTPGGHLFPQRVKNNTVITYDKRKHPCEEVVTVTHADFDSLIDPTVFTLAGLGLNENQVIGLPGLDHMDRPLWRNGKADPSYTVRKRMEEMAKSQPDGGQTEVDQPTRAPYPSQGNTAAFVAIGAAVLSLVTVVVAVVIGRRRASR